MLSSQQWMLNASLKKTKTWNRTFCVFFITLQCHFIMEPRRWHGCIYFLFFKRMHVFDFACTFYKSRVCFNKMGAQNRNETHAISKTRVRFLKCVHFRKQTQSCHLPGSVEKPKLLRCFILRRPLLQSYCHLKWSSEVHFSLSLLCCFIIIQWSHSYSLNSFDV